MAWRLLDAFIIPTQKQLWRMLLVHNTPPKQIWFHYLTRSNRLRNKESAKKQNRKARAVEKCREGHRISQEFIHSQLPFSLSSGTDTTPVVLQRLIGSSIIFCGGAAGQERSVRQSSAWRFSKPFPNQRKSSQLALTSFLEGLVGFKKNSENK